MAKNQKTFDIPSGVTEIGAAVQKHFATRSEILNGLLKEGSIVEQAISDLAVRSYEALPPNDRVFDAAGWRKWTKQLVDDLNWDVQSKILPTDRISFGKQGTLNMRPHRLAELWVQQPWSPLFMDWQITWFPSTQSGTRLRTSLVAGRARLPTVGQEVTANRRLHLSRPQSAQPD